MKAWPAAAMLVLAASMAPWAGPRPALVILDEARRPLSTIAVPRGFTVSFIHSINLSPVDEEYVVDAAGEIILERMLFDQLSTGMPSGDEDGFAVEGGRFATRPRRRFKEIQARVSPVPGHSLEHDGKKQALTRWAPVGGLLILRGARMPPFQ
jgi:hypothetical protein